MLQNYMKFLMAKPTVRGVYTGTNPNTWWDKTSGQIYTKVYENLDIYTSYFL